MVAKAESLTKKAKIAQRNGKPSAAEALMAQVREIRTDLSGTLTRK